MPMTDQNFEIWQGEDKRITFTVLDGANQPKDLTGCTVKWVMTISGTLSISKSTITNNIIVIDNKAQVILNGSDTLDVRAGTYNYECRVIDTSLISEIVTTGNITVHTSKTK